VAITSHTAGAIIERLDGAATFTAAVTDATAAELFSDVGNTGSFVSWGAMAIAAGVASVAKLPATTDCNEAVVLKVTATGAGGTTTSATVTVKIRAKEADYGTLLGSWLLTRGVTLNGGADVAQINDQSGNARHLTADAGKQPAYSATGWNGAEPACDFDGAAEFMRANGVGVALAGTDVPFTLVITLQMLAQATGKYVVGCSAANAGANGRHYIQTGSATNAIQSRRTDDAAANDADTTTETLGVGRHIVSMVFTGTAITIYLDGTVTTVSAAVCNVGLMSTARFGLAALIYGIAETVTGYANMRVASCHVYNAALDDTNRAAVRTLQKLRFSGLP